MNSTLSTSDRVDQLGRASRRYAFLSLAGFVLVFGALVYAAVQLSRLVEQTTDLRRERAELQSETESLRRAAATYRQEAANARQAVASSRAAINAFHAGRLEDAVALYGEALQADPDNAYLRNLRAYALFRLRRVDEAIEEQERSLATDPQYAWGYFDLARFLCAAGGSHFEEAVRASARAISLRPDLRGIMERDGEFQRVCRGRLP